MVTRDVWRTLTPIFDTSLSRSYLVAQGEVFAIVNSSITSTQIDPPRGDATEFAKQTADEKPSLSTNSLAMWQYLFAYYVVTLRCSILSIACTMDNSHPNETSNAPTV